MDFNKKSEHPSPEIDANVFSKLFFCWILPFLRYGYRNNIQMRDIYNTTEKNIAGGLGDSLQKYWKNELKDADEKKKRPNLLKVVIKMFGWSYMKCGLLLVIETVVLRNLQTQFLYELLRFFQNNENDTKMTGWLLGTGLFVVHFLDNFIFQQYFIHCQLVGLRVKVSCSSLLYRKILRLNHTSLRKTSSGDIVNLLSNDLQRLEQAAVYLHFIYAVPLQVIVMSYITYNIVGIICLPSLLFIIIEGLILQGYLSKIQARLRSKITLLTSRRLITINDIISGIHVIKMYAWEKLFERLVELGRKLELDSISKSSYAKALTVAMVVFTERLSLFLTVLVYVLQGNTPKGDMVFSIAQLLNIMQGSVCYYLPLSFESYGDIKLAISKLQEFLLLEEKVEVTTNCAKVIDKNTGAISLANVRVGWSQKTITLVDLTINIKPGTLCCILGKVGVGKTTFLHMLMKELSTTTGKVHVIGKFSYVSQEPWLFVGSVRNNIIFGQQFLEHKYTEVVRACALNTDFQQFPHRDQTMVGEKGVSLSGGQRARVNLARAVYLDADIYLLDDPLSAVDTQVAKHLFEECIIKYLQNKTRILVTHQLQFLKQADLVVILEEGRISKVMTNDDMSELNEILPGEDQSVDDLSSSKLLKENLSRVSYSSIAESKNGLEEDEEMLSEDVSLSSYIHYLSSGSNLCFLIFTFVLFVLVQFVIVSTDTWIMYWSNKNHNSATPAQVSTENVIYLLPEGIDLVNLTRFINISTNYYETNSNKDNTGYQHSEYFYLYVYIGLIVACVSLSIIRPMLFCKVCINASRALHRNLLGNILQAPMRFFETNPSGRILNRFSQDMASIDNILLENLLWVFQIYLTIIGLILTLCVVSPWIAIALLIAAIVSYYTVTLFLPTMLKIVKLEANSRSPIFSHISATICGLQTVRAFEAEELMRKYFDSLQDIHSATQYMTIVCCRSFSFYIEAIFKVVLAVVAFKFLITKDENIRSGVIGLVLTQTNILSGIFQYSITITTNVISSMVSVERVLQYTRVEKESSRSLLDNDKLLKTWPQSGKLTFTNVCLSYVTNGPPVLKNLSFNIKAGEKIGIVGRTGAGKSSLITCLFRLAPIEGSVAIDDVDTATVDLKTLRSRISIIPQEPVLFSESLRYNLDPLGTASDDTLWKVLENVKLKDDVDSLDKKVSNGGSNFSVGQRQLICLARAILRNNKILVMDEATANVDQNTDALIQRTIRKNFSNCTVLTIAHRLHTIMDSDRVLVMSSGQAVEFAHPYELLQKSNGYFLKMVQETGKGIEATLRETAIEDFEKKFVHFRRDMKI